MNAGISMEHLASAIGIRTEDAALVAALKAGSEEAFGVLIAHYSQPLYSLIARSLQDPADAQDITQEVFIKVFRSIGSFNGDASLRTWLYRIALHEASNQRRWWSRHKRQELTIDSPAGQEDGEEAMCLGSTLAAIGGSPYDHAELSELRARVDNCLRKLPEAFRSVVILREMEGFCYEEIGEILHLPAGTVKSRLKRGRSALERAFDCRWTGGTARRRCAMNANVCAAVRESFSGYLDGAISGREMQLVAGHLEVCGSCDAEFAAWRGMQQVLTSVGPVKIPAELGLKLRLAISHESARRQGHWWDGLSVRWDNLLRPALVQFSAGLAGALVLIGSIAMMLGMVAAPQAVLANDEPLGALSSPHYLYSTTHLAPVATSEDTTIVIQADINAAGEVYDYKIISGPTDATTDAQVRDQLLLQVYEPARVFGEPVHGQVLITFSGVSVRG